MAPTETIERELKLAAPDGFELPDLGGEPLEPRAFTSTYYDTSDHRLARAGITLRRRVEHGKGLWQLKLPEGTARRELEQAGGPAGPPRDLAHLLVALTHARELSPIAKLRTRRAGYRVADNGNGKADVVLDSVAVMDARRVVGRFTELEVELVEGDEQALEAISGALRKAGAGEDEPRPKVFRILGLPGDDPAAPADDAAALRAMLARQHEQILANDPGVRLGDDPEAVHRLRVATRRLRAVLRAAAPLLEREWSESLREELAWLADALGPVRDLDVFERYLRAEIVRLEPTDEAAAAELVMRLAGERETARTAMLGELESERYFDLLGVLDGAIPPVLATGPSLEAIAGREFAKLRKTILRSGPDPSDEKLHRIRIKGKRARYAAELAEPRVGKRSRRFVQAAKRFQDVVGEHQDAVVAEERIRALAGRRKAGLAFAAGRLVERQAARRAEARAALPQAWARLEKRGRRAWA